MPKQWTCAQVLAKLKIIGKGARTAASSVKLSSSSSVDIVILKISATCLCVNVSILEFTEYNGTRQRPATNLKD